MHFAVSAASVGGRNLVFSGPSDLGADTTLLCWQNLFYVKFRFL